MVTPERPATGEIEASPERASAWTPTSVWLLTGLLAGWPVLGYILFIGPAIQLEGAYEELPRCVHEESRAHAPFRRSALCASALERLPTWQPATSARAEEIARDIHAARAADDVVAASRAADRDERELAVARLLEARRAGPPDATLTSPFDVVDRVGASELIVAHADEARSLAERALVTRAALAVGDTDEARRMIRAAAEERYTLGATRRSLVLNEQVEQRIFGAAACLLGEDARGLRALREAEEAERELLGRRTSEAHIGLAACGGATGGPAPRDVEQRHARVAELSLGARAGVNDLRPRELLVFLAAQHALDGRATLHLLALADGERPLSADEALRWLDAANEPERVWRYAPELVGARPPLDPWAVTRVAERLRALAGAETREPSRAGLEGWARAASLAAGVELAERGAVADASRALEPALVDTALPRGLKPQLAYALRLLGRFDEARAIIAHARAEHPAGDATDAELEIEEALALAALGRMDEAADAAERAHRHRLRGAALVRPAPGARTDGSEVLWDRALAESSWLLLALARRARRPLPTLDLAEQPRAWALLAQLSPARRPSDWFERSAPARIDARALGPALYLMGESAPGDVEVWLDQLVPPTRYSPTSAVQRARAVAASWRGDDARATTWDARRARIASLVTDYRALALAWVAGL